MAVLHMYDRPTSNIAETCLFIKQFLRERGDVQCSRAEYAMDCKVIEYSW